MNNPELRAVLTEALSRSYYRIVGSSSDCRVDPGEILADAVLSLPGVAVIQLPEPSHGPDGEGRVTWTPSVSSVTATPNAVWDEDFDMTPEHAHELGVALLAAAVVAEGEDK
ncbi:hypothetical protein I5H37_gp080 [Mycobacterium phage Filuzino]|uniref:Uncharacterized protein n=1 Tax=Mycobacterium phage Filuzino TaxID=2484209 RepID=A0A3G3LZA1_9CAUD|nr:hypothetical protein I5H37_gp080 [Mycobacterium phage Filuzino]AYQ99425.1 hypothetical protein PBI_FILUZINO_80 [Mycobacterium phage Filuzino]